VTVTTPPPQGPPLRGAYLLGGRYHLLERLSGRGATWRARDELLHRDVAITEILLPPPGPERRPLLQAVRAAAAVRHPGIITVHDVIDTGDRLWVVRELVDGRTLSDVLRTEGPQPDHRVAEIGLHVLDAVAAAWAQGVRHGSLGTDHVLLARDGRILVTGFGFPPPGPDTDELRALAVTLYTALEGRPPGGRAPVAVGGTPLVDQQTTSTPSGPLASLLSQLLDDASSACRPDPQSIRQALEHVASSRPRRERRRPVVAAVAVAVALTAVAVLLVLLREPEKSPVAGASLDSRSTVTTTAPPLPTAFPAIPDLCKVITDEQAEELLLKPAPEPTGENGCRWETKDWKAPKNLRYRLWVQAQRFTAKSGDTAEERAEAGLQRLRARDRDRSTTGIGIPLIHHVSPRDLPGFGESAYTFETTNGVSYNTGIVFRVANLVVSVQYERSIPTDPDHLGRAGARKAARFVLEGLRQG